MNYDIIIGLEIHAEVKTKSKMFCSCKNDPFNSKANENTCPICLGHPGTLPKANKEAIEKIILLGLALDCKINQTSKFDRKNYFYPDLPKGYQISQFDLPFAYNGLISINKQDIEITRIHLEEDTGKLNHPSGRNYTLMDFNRSGVPLIELVTEPVIHDAITAKMFCQTYQQVLQYLEISDANMEKGEMRCEANISLQEKGSWERDSKGGLKSINNKKLNSKVEVKNINSFKSLEKAINFEIKRQSELLDKGQEVLPETRGCKDGTGETVRQRVKESSADYRYFPEPDILPIKISDELITSIRSKVKELPHKKRERFVEEYRISPEISEVMTSSRNLANWFENVMSELREWISVNNQSVENQEIKLAKLTSNWITSELFKLLNEFKQDINQIKITAENFAEFICLIHQEKINSSSGQKILKIMFETGGDPSNIMDDLGLEQKDESNSEELKKTIEEIVSKNKEQFDEFKNGKDSLLQYFIGQTMAQTQGKYNPKNIIEILNSLK